MKTGDWCIERKLANHQWGTVLEGYATEQKARAAATRQAKSPFFTSRWRVVCDAGNDGGRILEATFEPGERVVWKVVQQSRQAEHKASADCWCQPEATYTEPDTGATVYLHRGVQ